jgi:hypothetical protein
MFENAGVVRHSVIVQDSPLCNVGQIGGTIDNLYAGVVSEPVAQNRPQSVQTLGRVVK